MKIEDRKRKCNCFGDLKKGDAFSIERIMYIKTEELKTKDNGLVNAIGLEDGDPVFFYEFDGVFLPDCKVIVEEEL